MRKWIYSFEEGSSKDRVLLGGKGANLAEMTHLGLPVPPGFTLTTESCMNFLDDSEFLDRSLKNDILEAINQLEAKTNKSFTGKDNVLLVSVRSGAASSMPGMMDTILNLGLNDDRVQAFAQLTNADFAYDCYQRLLQMFADVVYGIDRSQFTQVLTRCERDLKKNKEEFTEADHQQLVELYKQIFLDNQFEFPQDPVEQLFEAIKAVFYSWNNHRARVYRNLHHIPHNMGTAVNIQAMVFGNSGDQSGTGVVFTRNPATGEATLFGEFLMNAQGEDVVAGIRTPHKVDQLEEILPQAYRDLVNYAKLLENHYKDMQDIEFTIEDGHLFILQTRNGKRTAKASLKIALDLVDEGSIAKEEALLSIAPENIDQLIHPDFDKDALAQATLIGRGLPASPGAASGELVFTAEKAKEYHLQGRKVILVRQETSPEDIEGMVVSEAIVTSRGGMTSHAAVVARGMGTCCVTACEDFIVQEELKKIEYGGAILVEGDIISVDGSTGSIYLGEIPTSSLENSDDLQQILEWADEFAKLKVRGNAETLSDLQTAIDFGASGIGLARTEHMFFGESRVLEMRRLILAKSDHEFDSALAKLLSFQEVDFYQMFKAVGDRPMVIRLLDPPLHEFLPHDKHEIEHLAKQLERQPNDIHRQIDQLQETNPMLGHRGCRLGITEPRIYQMQVQAIFNSVIRLTKEEGLIIQPEIMVPLVSDTRELTIVKEFLINTITQIFSDNNLEPSPYEIGTMIELPRACLIADEIADHADFFSFGTNDLTQMTFGFSRDDIGKFINTYTAQGIMKNDPFQTLDTEGVGKLIQTAVEKGRQVKPSMEMGICGEVGGDPRSIPFFHAIGVDYVSCSPYRIPAARLTAAQASLRGLG